MSNDVDSLPHHSFLSRHSELYRCLYFKIIYNKNMDVRTLQIAKHLCEKSGWSITNLRLQKILYIIQMIYIGENKGQPLFDDCFEAWDYGPVIQDVYHMMKVFGNKPIRDIFPLLPQLDKDTQDFVDNISNHLSKLTSGQLVSITHMEGGAWDNNYRYGSRGNIIKNEDILNEYRKRQKTNS